MSEKIIVELDLDSSNYHSSLDKVESDSQYAAKNVGEAFEKSVARKIDGEVVSSFKLLQIQLLGIVNTASKVVTVFGAALPVIVFLEKRFGVVSSLAEKLGLDFDNLVMRSRRLAEAFKGWVYGEESLFNLKLQAGLLLRELKLVDSAGLTAARAFEVIAASAVPVTVATTGLALMNTRVLSMAKDAKTLGSNLTEAFMRPKGLLELTSLAGLASGALFLISENMIHSEEATTRWIGTLAKLGAILTGGLAAWLTIAVFKIAELTQVVAGKLITYFQRASETFIQTSSQITVLTAAIDTMNRTTSGAIGNNEMWLETINEISRSLNLSNESLRKSAQEIVLVGNGMGLTTDQMKQLLKVSAEYAKINYKDVFDTTVSMINALNGSSQSVQALGIKLSEASVQQFLFKSGMTQSLETMSEGQKVQARYNKLLSQYSDISGLGAVAAGTLADQQEKLQVNTERLAASLGRGAAIIEQNNLVAFALNSVLDNVNETVISTAGFFGALGARLLQVTGVAIEITFKVFALTKALTLLDILLKSKTWDDFSNRKIPLINKSFQDLLYTITGSNVKLASSRDLLFAVGQAVINQFKSFIGLQDKATSGTSAFADITKALSMNLRSGMAFLIPFLIPFAKIAAVAGTIVAAFVIVKNVFEELEKRTKVFSSLWGILTDELMRGASVFAPLIEFFTAFSDKVSEIGSKAFGMLVFGLAKAIQAVNALISLNPMGVFSDQTVAAVSAVNDRLQSLTSNLQSVAFDIRQIPGEAERAVASVGEKSSVNLEDLVNKLRTLRDELRNVGLSDKEIIERDQAESLETLRLAFENKLLAEQEYLALREKVNLDAQTKLKEIESKAAKERQQVLDQANRIINQSLGNAISGGIQQVVSSLAKGKNIFADFGSFLINLFGDLAIQLGQFYIADGLAKLALLQVSPGAQIAAGASLIALGSIMKAFFAGGIGGGAGGVAGIGAQPGPGQQPGGTIADPAEIEERNPQTNVEIVVQGSLVQQEELGQFITRTLNDSFAKQGVRLTDARFA